MHRRTNRRRFRPRSGRISGRFGLILASGILAALAATGLPGRSSTGARGIPTATVRRADINAVVVAAGRLESARSTEVRCTLERLTTGSAPTILSMVDDGAIVKKGDVLCELDSADYQELVRRQAITVSQARASFRQAELALEVARISLQAYRQGEMRQTDRLFRGQIALADSDLNRQKDRLRWTERMVAKGYFSLLQFMTEEQALRRATLSLAQARTAFEIYLRFSAPIALRALESEINGAQAAYDFQDIKLRREEERLVLYQTMVDRCTVRAPHDGLVVHANRSGRTPEVWVGATVRQRQRLFYLPDLSRIEVEAMLHETVVSRVQPGMPARVRIEALPDLTLEGVVTSIAPLPYSERKTETGSEVTYFVGRVRLARIPEGLRPGMSAELEILTVQRQGVLAVPREAVTAEGGRDVCYVRRPEHLEQRTVRLGQGSYDLVEVLDGLAEGEVVVLHTP